jgi:predicted dehydrogenase
VKRPELRIGFIGAGIIANRHMGNLLGFEDVEVVAVADLDQERARALAARSGGRAYGDYEAMLDREQLEAVYVCVPPFAHGGPEAALIERGLPFFVQKPLAADLDTAEEVACGVRERGLVTAAGYHWRYLDIVERARELLGSNPPRLALGYWIDFTPPPAWWTQQALSGGQVVEQTTHVLDLAQLLVGEVRRVYAASARSERAAFPQADIADVSAATLHFASGALGNFASTCLLNWPHRIGLHLFAEGLAVEVSEFELMVDVGKGRPIRKAEGDPFIPQDRDFLDAVLGKANRVRVPYEEALRTHRLACALFRSAEQGRVVELGTETEAEVLAGKTTF